MLKFTNLKGTTENEREREVAPPYSLTRVLFTVAMATASSWTLSNENCQKCEQDQVNSITGNKKSHKKGQGRNNQIYLRVVGRKMKSFIFLGR